jgi:hypothetical protein
LIGQTRLNWTWCPVYCTQRSSQKDIKELPVIVQIQRPGRRIFKLRPNGKITLSNSPKMSSWNYLYCLRRSIHSCICLPERKLQMSWMCNHIDSACTYKKQDLNKHLYLKTSYIYDSSIKSAAVYTDVWVGFLVPFDGIFQLLVS